MAKYFQDPFVKWSYRVETRSDQDPSLDNLRAWDETLEARYGPYLDQEMADAGIPLTRRSRSVVAMLCVASTGSGAKQVRRACEYWKRVLDLRL